MRLLALALLPFAALLTGGAAPERPRAPFDGAWMSCETYRGTQICSYKLMRQSGARVCGVQQYFATNAYYVQRFIAKADGNSARVERICGDPGSETSSYCTGQAPDDAARVGWETTDHMLHACGNRLYESDLDQSFNCATTRRDTGVPKVRSLAGNGPAPEDAAWMASCVEGNDD